MCYRSKTSLHCRMTIILLLLCLMQFILCIVGVLELLSLFTKGLKSGLTKSKVFADDKISLTQIV